VDGTGIETGGSPHQSARARVTRPMSREGFLRVEGNRLEAMLQQGLFQGEGICERSIAEQLFEVHASPLDTTVQSRVSTMLALALR